MKLPLCLRLGLLASVLALAGCETTNNPPSVAASAPEKPAFVGYKSPYPGKSGVAISPVLERDAIRSLRWYLRQLPSSEEFEIIDRRTLGAATDFMIDGAGRLVGGNLHEIWTIRHEGKVEKLEFIMYPDGKRGNTVGFKPYKG